MTRFVTYNVHGFIGRDRRYDIRRVAAVLAELDADVVGLQEVSATTVHPTPWTELGDDLGMHAVAGPTLIRSDGPYGNALLTRLQPDTTRLVDLSVADREPRGAILASVGAWQTVVSHLGLRSSERRLQARRLAVELQAHVGATVLLADANSVWPRSSALAPLAEQLTAAPWHRSFPAHLPLLPLDRIWTRGAVVQRTWVHRSEMARTASDHLPVCAELEPV